MVQTQTRNLLGVRGLCWHFLVFGSLFFVIVFFLMGFACLFSPGNGGGRRGPLLSQKPTSFRAGDFHSSAAAACTLPAPATR